MAKKEAQKQVTQLLDEDGGPTIKQSTTDAKSSQKGNNSSP